MCCPVSESLVSVAGHGSSNRIMTQNTQLKPPRMAKSKTLDYSEVAFYEPWSKSYWTSVEGAETCSLEKAPFKPETAGAVCSQGVGQNTRWQVQKSHWELQKSIDCSDCLKRLCNKILKLRVPSFLSRPVSLVYFLLLFCWTTIQKQCLIFISSFSVNLYLLLLLSVSSYFSDHCGFFFL